MLWQPCVEGGGEAKVKKTAHEKRLEKKKRIKALFDAEYDAQGGNGEGGETFYDKWKQEAEQQAEVRVVTLQGQGHC